MTEHDSIEAIAGEVITSLSNHSQIPPFSSRPGGLSLAQAYRIMPLLRSAFEARGERITGRKIGFTNRQMWTVFGVDSPVWGYATSRTTHDLAFVHEVGLSDFAEPRIEPEIMFGLGSGPAPTMSDGALLDCVDWIALGYEVVQCIFPGWIFSASDTVAANGVHGALLIGARHAVAPRRAEWLRELQAFEVELYCDDGLEQRGGGSLVLDSPLNALRHLVELLANDPYNPPLAAGDVVSTGTLTLAMPIKPGQRWTTKASGIPLEDITIRFT
jgi:2-oxo-3-hexenedioate decarboxylase